MKWCLSVFFVFTFIFLTAFGVNCCYGYFFPQKYSSEISAVCEKFDVEKAVVFSMINIESRFNKNAVSNKGAVGLMQIMPSTAEALATELSLEEYDLKNPKDNILLGTYYISQLTKRFGSLETALCAYNAGPSNVSLWLKDKEKSEDGKTLDEIPFVQTRTYIKKFKNNYKYYSKKIKA